MADKYFWLSEKKSFGRSVTFGDEMPELDHDRVKLLKSQGMIGTKKPESFTEAQNSALEVTKAENAKLKNELAELKKSAKKEKGGK